jgi:hypothetical protein
MGKRRRVNPYQLLSFTQLTREYARIKNEPRSEELRSQSRDLCECLINRGEMRESCMADTIRSMIGQLQEHVGDQ